MSFLQEGYEPPKGSDNFLKLNAGDNRLRILSNPVCGYVSWIEENDKKKPIRIKLDEKFPLNKIFPDPKMFWSMVVWDYSSKSVKLWELTSRSIQKKMEKWDERGLDPKEFDIIVSKEGTGMTTKYDIDKEDKEEPTEEIIEAYKNSKLTSNMIWGKKEDEDTSIEDVNF